MTRACAVAFEVGQGIDVAAGVGGCARCGDRAREGAVGKRSEADGEGAGAVGFQRSACGLREGEVSRQGERERQQLGGEIVDGELACKPEATGGRWAVGDLAGKDLQAHVLRMAAEGAVSAYEDITGEDWKPYARQIEQPVNSVDQKAASAQMAAFE